jgi:sulfide dehydrogenase cytochrome subunit
MKYSKHLMMTIILFMFPFVSFAAKQISTGALGATTCFSCHGPEGKFIGGKITPLAGFPEEFMTQQLLKMKSGQRKTTIMGRHLKIFSESEIKAIAKYFATLKP